MTRTDRSFPVAFRLLAAAFALVALSLLAPIAGATTRSDVAAAQAKYDAAMKELDTMKAELAAVQSRLNDAAAAVDQKEGELEAVTAALLDTRQQVAEAQARYDRIRVRLNERAAEAFIQGPGSSLGFLLGASTLADLSDRIEFVDAVTQSDAELSQEVQNLANQLQDDEAKLQGLQQQKRDQLAQTKAQRDAILADMQRQQELTDAIATKVTETLAMLRKTKGDFAEEQRAIRQAQRQAAQSGGHSSVPMPAGWEHVLQACPVAQPRSFGDGFGAPRYAGGYHLHAGNDILANYGTEIYAPFDGVARTSWNSLGGNAVYVEGEYGYVYNAHLQSYSSLSNGPVHAGDVIGYVGDTGDAIGTPHDHFEFHPNVIPSGWPASVPYGYSVIGTAINPYPLLVAACG